MDNNNIIELRDVTICQSNNHSRGKNGDVILKDVNFEVKRGELVYLIGEIGSGKSSLLKTLYGEMPLRDGVGTIAGYSLNKLRSSNIPYLRRKLGIVFQDFQLLPDRNIGENLIFALKATGWKKSSEINKRIEDVLRMIDFNVKSYRLPHNLSRGEQQRLAIGRALLNRPEIIIADEPTGNLDPNNSLEIIKLFKDIAESGTSVVVATHNIELIYSYPSRTYLCEKGSIAEIDINYDE